MGQHDRKTVLITGAAGYLGTIVLAELFSKRQFESRIIAMDIREVPPPRRRAGIQYLCQDLRSSQLSSTLRDNRVATVVHLAAIVTPPKGMTREQQYDIEVNGTKNLLQACLAASVRKIIVSSSGAAYGYHADNPARLSETHPLRGNRDFAYAYHKMLIEALLAHYRNEYPQLQQVVLRLSTILGETTDNQITDLYKKPFVLAARGSASPFVFVWDRDVARCVVQAIRSERTGVFNVAGDGALTLHELATILRKPVLALPAGLLRFVLHSLRMLHLTQYGPEQLDFLRFRPVLDNTRLKEEFGFVPAKTSREVFEYFVEKQRLR